jgi:hypothetical protein
MSPLSLIRAPAILQGQELPALLAVVEDLFPVRFSFALGCEVGIAGEILTASVCQTPKGAGMSVPSLNVPPPCENTPDKSELIEIAVRFLDDPDIPFPFRGRALRTKVSAQPNALATLSPRERVLATCESGPVWVVSENEGVKHFRSAFSLPVLPPDGGLQDVLNGRRFLEVLPLLHWLREVCSSRSEDAPALRACFIFDDPNLHWPRYGFVDYQHLAIRAEKENYHVAFATIPFDTWFTHNGTATIFRKHQSRLSLLVHGNNHTKRELAQAFSESERLFLLKHAIRRIERLERRSGLKVSRVMVPPHGACSEEMLAALPFCGFEAACISHGSLRAHNKARAWTKTLGYLPSEMVRGCPVFPRWGFSDDIKNTILLAAFLKQAIIIRGHHQDLKRGVELLDDLAGFINGLGPVVWSNMTDLSRSNQRWTASSRLFSASPTNSAITPKVALRKTLLTRDPARSVLFPIARRLLAEGRDRFYHMARRSA